MEEEKKEIKEDSKNETAESSDHEDAEKLASEENNKELDEKQLSPEEEILELKDKLARSFAEMENQRRRFEKEKQEAFEYGGFAFAKEALSLIDNIERSKQTLENDETLKDSEALKKILEHLKIINQDLISIFSKNNINPIECLNKKLDPEVFIQNNL